VDNYGRRAAVGTVRRWRDRLGISYITINFAFLKRFAPIIERG
jgi:hypothetical protein